MGRHEILRRISDGSISVVPLRQDTVRENGLDLRLSCSYAEPLSINGVVDPCEMGDEDVRKLYVVNQCLERIVIPPRSFVLAVTDEYIRLPRDVVGLVNLRSTLARYGLFVPPTVVDAGFEGQVVVELVNMSPNTVMLRPGTRFLHLVLVDARDADVYTSTYRGQTGVRLPKGLKNECGDPK